LTEVEVATQVMPGRWTAQIDGDFVVFLIGARFNSKWQALRAISDLGGRRGMRHMLNYLTEHPEKGLIGYETAGFTVIQYWRSFEHLEAFAKNDDDPHLCSVAELLEACRTQRPYRDLARDIPRARR
jgi:Monooxygenase af470-like